MKYLLIVGLAFCSATVSLAQQAATTPEIASAKTPVKKASSTPSAVLYLLSKNDMTSEISKAEFKKLKKKDIEYVKVLKDPVLLSMYGEKAKKGVILVQMKQNPNDKKKKSRQDSSRKAKEGT